MAGLRTFLLNHDPAFGRHLPLFVQQEKIGWAQFLKGLWHKDWCLAQDQFLHEVHQYNVKSTGTLWAIRLISFLRELVHTRWVEHTQSIHHPANVISARRQRLLTRISHLQSQYTECCPQHTHQFFLDTNDSHHTFTTLQNWLHLHESVIEKVIILHRQNHLLTQSLITTFFH